MTDAMQLLRDHDPAREPVDPPPVDALLARVDAEEAAPAVTPAPQRRRALTLSLAGAAAVTAIVLFASGIGGERTDVLSEARAAVASEGFVVHTITRTTIEQAGRPVRQVMQGRRQVGVGTMDGPVERWSASSPERWRELIWLLPGRSMPGGTYERAYADGVTRMRSSWRRGVATWRATPPPPGLAALGPRSSTQPFGTEDPLRAVRRLLDGGEVREAGETTRDGRRLLRLVEETPERHVPARGASARMFASATRTTYLLDATTYAPVEVVRKTLIGREFGWDKAMTSRTLFTRYERLPLDGATERLLRFGGR